MIAFGTLFMFGAAVTLLLLSPGPNMAFVLAQGASHGARGGVAAALGIGAADLLLTLLTASGVTAVVAAWPPAFELIRYAGVLYLLHLAYQALRRSPAQAAAACASISLATVFRRAMLNSLLNPKALLFFMVFLPQFVDLGRGPVARQLFVLGCVLTLIGTVFHTLLGWIGGAAGRYLAGRPTLGRMRPYALAALMLSLALRLVLLQRPA
ncbi:threonine/homoserine/homoserine lactone efflux protein [Janthinobacterium sp. CG_23.3]|uniref:LysE family translocator n=1 Tax=unclassified Janthinobacterium TaxID=2610881 RepID=UPI000348EBC7|nr:MULTISPECIES: LysE family translocator [unclassified Janthinobacterium]MEC5160570.1 threonine/homoserine/homoserine lactone efflux protein [Janthinobacterium sp. CG_S6]